MFVNQAMFVNSAKGHNIEAVSMHKYIIKTMIKKSQ